MVANIEQIEQRLSSVESAVNTLQQKLGVAPAQV